jgi:hypothetical protein
MLHIESIPDKKRNSNLFSFLCNGKHQILSTMVCYPSVHSAKGKYIYSGDNKTRANFFFYLLSFTKQKN